MFWTKELPKKIGYYWYKDVDTVKEVVLVTKDPIFPGQLSFQFCGAPNVYYTINDTGTAQWSSSPVEEPT